MITKQFQQLVGKPQLVEKFEQQGITTLFDLLFIFPIRYINKTFLTPIHQLHPGNPAYIEAIVENQHVDYGRRRSLAITLCDDKNSRVTMRFYYFNKSQQTRLQPGTLLRCYGEPSLGKTGLELYHPSYQIIQQESPPPLAKTLEPVYPKVEGSTAKTIAKIVAGALQLLKDNPLPDPLYQHGYENLALIDCLAYIHTPPPGADSQALQEVIAPQQLRLAREEFVAQQLFMRETRNKHQSHSSPVFSGKLEALTKLQELLPFSLTRGQQQAITEILDDIAQPKPMMRLLQGDVGSGKTLVALIAALQVVEKGGQVAFMVPTELLAEQHFTQCQKFLAPLKVRCALLRGNESASNKRSITQSLSLGVIDLIVGTHALFQDTVNFHKLGLVIVDEQHRFGVHQRMALRAKGEKSGLPHLLIMTATPIPRTLAMTAYADLQLSVIDHLPEGRKTIETRLISQSRRQQLLDRLLKYCLEGKQAYWVCRLVEESEQMDCESAEQTFDTLQKKLPQLRFGLVHGRCSREDKQQVMDSFRKGEIQVLVATTVIEVGVDVPNANLIVIENAEQLGLAQLHQLRGRVGRGQDQGYCMLLHADSPGNNGKERLSIIRQHSSGFAIAERDLQMRGAGQLLGARQSGANRLRIADLGTHFNQLETARKLADKITKPEHKQLLIDRWFRNAEPYLST